MFEKFVRRLDPKDVQFKGNPIPTQFAVKIHYHIKYAHMHMHTPHTCTFIYAPYIVE